MANNRERLKSQIFWEGSGELSYWYSYVNRAPHLYGHIMLANDEENADVRRIPKGFEAALTFNIEILLNWANEHKEEKCLPVFYRMNIAGEQFRVHILPVSHQEIEEASGSLVARIPEQTGDRGGFLHYLGGREHLADQRDAMFRKSSGNDEAVEKLMQDGGIPTLVSQLKNVVAGKAKPG